MLLRWLLVSIYHSKDEINETEQDQGDRDSLEHQEGQHTQHEDNMHEVQDSQSEVII